MISTRRTRSSPNVRASLASCQSSRAAAGGLWREQRELLTGRRSRPVQFQGQARDRGRRWGPFEPGEEQALDRLGVGGRLREALLDVETGGRPGPGEREIEVQVQPGPRGRQPAGDQLPGQGGGESMEHEPKRLEILDRGLDGQGEPEPLRSAPWAECLELLAARPGVDPRPFLAEPRDESGPGELGDRADPAQAEPGEPGPHVGVRREQAGRVRGEEAGLAAGRDDDGSVGARL